VRIPGHASEQYRKTSSLVEKTSEKKTVAPQAKTTTTSFGFRLGKFGLDYQSEKTLLDPSLSRDVREKKEKAQAFKAEAEVESLRAKVGTEGADYRETQTEKTATQSPPRSRVRAALTAYANSRRTAYPLPGNMLASVV